MYKLQQEHPESCKHNGKARHEDVVADVIGRHGTGSHKGSNELSNTDSTQGKNLTRKQGQHSVSDRWLGYVCSIVDCNAL